MQLYNKTTLSLLVFVFVVLAGCTSSPPAPDSFPSQSPTAGLDTGAIMGLVMDDELDPVANAQVALQGGESDPTLTDTDGRFQFSEVAPGRQTLFITALGYASIARSVDIVAGEITEVSVRLDPLTPTEPYTALEIREGYIACGTGVGASGVGGFTQVACGEQDANQRFLFNYTFDKNLKGILFEMSWRPTQALSKDLSLVVEKEGCGVTCTDADTYAEVQGCCVLRVALTVDELTKPAGEEPATDFTEAGGTIQTRTFPAYGEGNTPTTVFTGQEFEIFVEYVYHELPSDWETRTNILE